MLTNMIRHVVAMTTTKWNQAKPNQEPSHFAWNSETALFYNQVEPSGTEWNRIRNRAALLGILRRHVFTTVWNRVEPSQEPSYLLGFLAKTISTLTPIIILIKNQDSRIQGPQNEINCRILLRGAFMDNCGRSSLAGGALVDNCGRSWLRRARTTISHSRS